MKGAFGGIVVLVVIYLLANLVSCTVPEDKAKRLLASEGVTKAQLNGWAWIGCSQQDMQSIKFQGTKNGVPVSGVIYGGWGKAYTIRYN